MKKFIALSDNKVAEIEYNFGFSPIEVKRVEQKFREENPKFSADQPIPDQYKVQLNLKGIHVKLLRTQYGQAAEELNMKDLQLLNDAVSEIRSEEHYETLNEYYL